MAAFPDLDLYELADVSLLLRGALVAPKKIEAP